MDRDSAAYLVHLCRVEDWERAQTSGEYRADTLESAGFIHFSKPGQILKVANQYYPAARNLLLLWINQAKLVSELRWESSDGDIFPHLYGPLNLDSVMTVSEFQPDDDGVFRTIPNPKKRFESTTRITRQTPGRD
jgi:uncharacterized protein (DUF952 family)